MWTEETKNGFRLVDRVKINGKTCRVSVPMARNTPQALRQAQGALLDKISMKERGIKERRFSGLVDAYIGQKEIKPSTELNIRTTLKSVSVILDDPYVSGLTSQRIRNAFLESGKSPITLNYYMTILRPFLAWSYECGYIDSEITLKPFKVRREKLPSSDLYLEPGELAEVLSQLKGMQYWICRFLALTGCRIGEAAGLTLSDIKDKYIEIRRTCWRGEMLPPKSADSVRDVFIQDELREMLSQYMEWRRVYMMTTGIRTDLLFFSRHGNPAYHFYLNNQLKKIDIGKNLHPHIFRHTHTALLAEQGVSLEAISRRLGHADSRITKEVYFHVTEKMKEKEEATIKEVRICP